MIVTIHTATKETDNYHDVEMPVADILPFIEVLKHCGMVGDTESEKYKFEELSYDAVSNQFEIYLVEKLEPPE